MYVESSMFNFNVPKNLIAVVRLKWVFYYRSPTHVCPMLNRLLCRILPLHIFYLTIHYNVLCSYNKSQRDAQFQKFILV